MNTTESTTKIEIGTVSLRKEKLFYRSYESYAVWHANVKCPPQHVLLYAEKPLGDPEGRISSVTATFHGMISDAYPRRRVGLKEDVTLTFPVDEVETILAGQMGAVPPGVLGSKHDTDYEFRLNTEKASLVSTFGFANGGAVGNDASVRLELVFSHGVDRCIRSFRNEHSEALLLLNGQPCA